MILRIILICSNICIIIFVGYSLFVDGVRNLDYFLFCSWFIITAVLNIVYVLKVNEKSWLSLFLKRKALEEKRKIQKLEINN
jgi:hypothetical protein